MGIALALGCAFAGCFTPVTLPPGSSATSLTLVVASWSGPTLPIVIASVHNGASLTPSNLTYLVKDANGTVYLSGPAGTGPPTNGARVSIDYGDTTGAGKVTAGDGLLLTLNASAPESYGNLTLDVLADGVAAAHAVLPAAPSAASQPHITLSAGNWNNGNVSLDITAVENGGTLTPSSLLFLVTDSSGAVYYSAGAGHPHTVGMVAVNVTYNDNLDAGKVTVGDSIRLTVSPPASTNLVGGFFSVAVGTQELGHVSLP
jgi:hypothetical protein